MKKRGRMAIRLANTAVNLILFFLSMVIGVICVYSLVDDLSLQRNARDTSLLVYKPTLETQANDTEDEFVWNGLENQVAWLCVEDTDINFPVMQGEDNFVYLNKDPYGEYRLSGSIFLDYRNSADFQDDYAMIYGHHMDYHTMFGTLDLFVRPQYFESHRTGWLATPTGRFDLEIFAVSWGDSEDRVIFYPRNRTIAEILDYIEETAVLKREYQEGASILALSTCAGEKATSRLIVFAMLKERND